MKKKIISVLNVLLFLIVAAFNLEAKSEGHHEEHWGYTGKNSPEHWGDMKKDFENCKIGKVQSPINIDSKSAGIKKTTDTLAIQYAESKFDLENNGHTVQVNLDKKGSIEISGKKYNLIQFHFHAPSEEQIDGKNADMVAYLVHKSDDGKLAVVAVLFNLGSANAFLNHFWGNLPKEPSKYDEKSKMLNVSELLPEKKDFYTFMGSLTTPPCTEGVKWFVLKNRVNVSKEQLDAFKKIFPASHRPVQPLNNREIFEN